MKIFHVYFAHTFSTATLGAAQLRTGTSPRRGTTKFVIRGSNSTRKCVIFPDFEEKIVHVIFHVKCLRYDEKFLSVGGVRKRKNYVRVKNLCVRKNLRVRKKNFFGKTYAPRRGVL